MRTLQCVERDQYANLYWGETSVEQRSSANEKTIRDLRQPTLRLHTARATHRGTILLGALRAQSPVRTGYVGTLRPDEVREKCQTVLGNVAHGRHPLHGVSGINGPTL